MRKLRVHLHAHIHNGRLVVNSTWKHNLMLSHNDKDSMFLLIQKKTQKMKILNDFDASLQIKERKIILREKKKIFLYSRKNIKEIIELHQILIN